MPGYDTAMDYEREQEEAAASEAGQIGGPPDHELDYAEVDDRPNGIGPEAWRAVEEGGGGQSEGFEEAEAALIERAENAHGPSPIKDAEHIEEEPLAAEQVDAEADGYRSIAERPENTNR
jgi:hypothetical protein